jgi:hypothetical protein
MYSRTNLGAARTRFARACRYATQLRRTMVRLSFGHFARFAGLCLAFGHCFASLALRRSLGVP